MFNFSISIVYTDKANKDQGEYVEAGKCHFAVFRIYFISAWDLLIIHLVAATFKTEIATQHILYIQN